MRSAIGYLTVSDLISQRAMIEDDHKKMERIKRNLKIALLFHDKVIFRATAPILSNLTSKLFIPDGILNEDNASCLLDAGFLVPEIREGEEENLLDETFLKGILKTDDSSSIDAILPIANVINNAREKEQRDAKDLSDKRTKYYVNQIFRLYFYQKENENYAWIKPTISIAQLEEVFIEYLPYGGIPPRDGFGRVIGEWFIDPRVNTHITQNTYFLKGAEESKANPIWTKEIDPKEKKSIWRTPYPKLSEFNNRFGVSSTDREILERHGFIQSSEIYQSYNFPFSNATIEEDWQSIQLDPSHAVKISFSDIVKIKHDKDWISFLHEVIDTDDIRRGHYEEEKRLDRIKKRIDGLATRSTAFNIATQLVTDGLFDPITSNIKGIALFFNGGSVALKIANEKLSKGALHSFSEFVKEEKYKAS